MSAQQLFETDYWCTINKLISAIDEDAYKKLAMMCNFPNLAQLRDYMGAGNEIGSLLLLLEKREGINGLKKFYQVLAKMDSRKYIEVQDVIKNGPCKEMFCPNQ